VGLGLRKIYGGEGSQFFQKFFQIFYFGWIKRKINAAFFMNKINQKNKSL
jgi:hypothetical protein